MIDTIAPSAFFEVCFRLIPKLDKYALDGFTISALDKIIIDLFDEPSLGGDDLIDSDIVLENKKRLYLNYLHPLVAAVKKAYDLDRLSMIPLPERSDVYLFSRNIKKQHKSKLRAVVLIGSFARLSWDNYSDLDILVLTTKTAKPSSQRSLYSRKLQTIHMDTDVFSNKLKSGDDLAIWAVKYGVTLYGDNLFNGYRLPKKISVSEESLSKKRVMVQSLMEKIETGTDLPEMRINTHMQRMVNQMARIIIILNGDFPLSRPELPRQVKAHDPDFADAMTHLYDYGKMDYRDMSEIGSHFKFLYKQALRKFSQ